MRCIFGMASVVVGDSLVGLPFLPPAGGSCIFMGEAAYSGTMTIGSCGCCCQVGYFKGARRF